MAKWIEKIENVLAKLSIPFAFERMSCDEKQLPDTFITYFMVANPGMAWGNGKERYAKPRIQVSLFYRDKSTFLDVPQKTIAALEECGFCRVDEGRIPYQTNTGHYGWRCDFYYYEKR